MIKAMDDLHNETLSLAKTLIRAESISPRDEGCQQLIADYLADLGFDVEQMPFGDVSNLWATRKGQAGAAQSTFVFAGHTDVVPPGPASDWATDPFEPTLVDDMLYGRGAADMKGSLSAMLTGTRRFLEEYDSFKGDIGFLITSDEEADAVNGTVKVLETLKKRRTPIDWCVVGEPSSSDTLGDVVRVGRRGSLNASLRIIGQQGHVAYPKDAINPIHAALQALADLGATSWDDGNEYFPPTSMQMSNIHSGTGVNNVIPGDMSVVFNFRFSTESTQASLQAKTTEILDKHDFTYDLNWSLSGNPFMTTGGELIPAVQTCIMDLLNVETVLSTSGGTSDGRFIAPYGAQVVELGPCNKTIHKVNECVSVSELFKLSTLYTNLLKKMLV